MEASPTIGAIAAALAKAQGEMAAAAKDSTNPHFKSRYADLASVWDACREPLTKHGLAVMQPVRAEGAAVTITTMLVHTSGEWISEALTITAQQATPQGVGSAITYGRRYGLSAMVGVAPDDDDAEGAEGRGKAPVAVSRPAPVERVPDGYDEWAKHMKDCAEKGWNALSKAWSEARPDYRKQLMAVGQWEALKAIAEAGKVPA